MIVNYFCNGLVFLIEKGKGIDRCWEIAMPAMPCQATKKMETKKERERQRKKE